MPFTNYRPCLLAALLLLAAGRVPAQSVSPMPALLPVPAAAALPSSSMRTYALRLRPGQDVRQQLQEFVVQHQVPAAAVLTCVGSLTQATLRLANQEGPTVLRGHFEVVSLVGTLSVHGSHLHLAVADSTGRTIGGHLLEGSLVYTTAELVIGVLDELEFRREVDPTFGYRELQVAPAPARRKKAGPR